MSNRRLSWLAGFLAVWHLLILDVRAQIPVGGGLDLVVPIPAGQDFEVLCLLRMLLHGMSPPDVYPELRT